MQLYLVNVTICHFHNRKSSKVEIFLEVTKLFREKYKDSFSVFQFVSNKTSCVSY